MRGRTVAFFGVVAIVASCSSYGEDERETPGPGPAVTDGGSSGSSTEAGADGANPPDHEDGDAPIDGATSTLPTIVQTISQLATNGSATSLSFELPKPIVAGDSILVLAAATGTKVSDVLVGGLSLDAIVTAGPFENHSAWLKPFPSPPPSTTVNVLFSAGANNAMVTVVELGHVGAHTQNTNNGTGKITVNQLATTPNDLVIASVLTNGTEPDDGPLNGEKLVAPLSFNGQQLLSAKSIATEDKSPPFLWTAMGAIQWDAIAIAFKPAP